MADLTSRMVKTQARALGAQLCGIAPIERFAGMPGVTHPATALPGTRSVVVLARRFLRGTAACASTVPYTIVRNALSRELDQMTLGLSYYLEDHGWLAVPTGAIEPCNHDPETDRTVGLISLKHAAVQAGLGVVGKNTLLVTPRFGNMVWLGAVLTDAPLEPDPLLERNPCAPGCRICIEQCPVGALDGSPFMNQKACWEHAFGREGGGEWRIKCHRCRTGCPHSQGYDSRPAAGKGRPGR